LGLLKVNFLSLKSLTIIANGENFIKKYDLEFSIAKVPYGDENTYKLLNSGETIGAFQLGESDGMHSICKRLKNGSIEEINDILALYRPGSME
jgi:DNA polymerase-3 subunit alpha